MIRPVKMTLAEIVCEKSSIQQILNILYRYGCVHIENSSRLTPKVIENCSFPENDISIAQNLKNHLTQALKAIDLNNDTDSEIEEPASFSNVLQTANSRLKTCTEIIGTHKEFTAVKNKKEQALLRESYIEWLSSMNIEKSLCIPSDRITIMCGTIPEENAGILYNDDEIMCVTSKPLGALRYALAVYFSEKTDKTKNGNIETLRRADFSEIDIKSASENSETFAARESDLKKKLDLYCTEIPLLRKALYEIEEYIRMAGEIRKCGITGQCTHLACWIPSSAAGELMRLLQTRWKDICTVRILPAEKTIDEEIFLDEEIPSLLRTSRFFIPFRSIVGAYGWPAYRHIDPTAPGAIFFLIFFGVMFADAGHGLVIAFLGALLRLTMRRASIQNAGMLMLYCGITAAIGGLLFGSFFGYDDVISPLLFHPGSHIGSFLLLGVVIGIIVISTGIILNIIQTLWRKDIGGAFFSQWGFLSLGFYWLCAGIIFSAFGNPSSEKSHTGVIIITALPLIAMIIGEIITQKKNGHADAAEIAFRPAEIILGLLSNSVSFVRIAAFGLCHAALMNAVYIIATSVPDSSFYRTMVSIEGNILVICLEALVVTIQCIRLQFYEFYSKFFGTTGKRFIPLRKNSRQKEAL